MEETVRDRDVSERTRLFRPGREQQRQRQEPELARQARRRNTSQIRPAGRKKGRYTSRKGCRRRNGTKQQPAEQKVS